MTQFSGDRAKLELPVPPAMVSNYALVKSEESNIGWIAGTFNDKVSV
ncbi:MAG: hypothetical protein OXF46_08865 [Rhodobacteraceae bacterium]|nr:hypothetical protein [Paracoccaceae bacterium]